MHQRRRLWMGAVLCAMAVLLVGVVPMAAAAEGEGHDGGLINLDKSLIIQIVNFLLLLWLLHRLLYKPLVAKMEERTGAIKKSLEEAQVARAQAAKQQEENVERLRAAHAEAEAIRTRALKEAGEEQRRLVERARLESQRLVESAK